MKVFISQSYIITRTETFPPFLQCHSHSHTFWTSWPSSSIQSTPSVAQHDTNSSMFCCMAKCLDSKERYAQTRNPKRLRVSSEPVPENELLQLFRVIILAWPSRNWPGRLCSHRLPGWDRENVHSPCPVQQRKGCGWQKDRLWNLYYKNVKN